jgi:hypothetical protein
VASSFKSNPGPRLSAQPLQATRQRTLDSFYHLSDAAFHNLGCQGTACFIARHLDPSQWSRSAKQRPQVYCLGKCFAAPSGSSGDERPRIEVHAPEAVVLANLVQGGARRLSQYLTRGGYSALESALFRQPWEILDEVDRSGLRGRGGAFQLAPNGAPSPGRIRPTNSSSRTQTKAIPAPTLIASFWRMILIACSKPWPSQAMR